MGVDAEGAQEALPSFGLALPGALLAQQLQATLDTLRTTLAVPGVSVAVISDRGAQWLGVSGFADVAAGKPMQPTTGFSLASISKTFTAAVVLELVSEGRLRLDQPVAPLLPAYALDKRITIRMLLDHTSGLPDFYSGKGADKALGVSNAVWTPAMSWSFVPVKHWTPGSIYVYSNTNYLLLGELIRAVTGHVPSVEIRRRLLGPLHLDHLWYQQDEAPRAPMPASYALAAAANGKVTVKLVAPAGSVTPFVSVVTASGAAGSMAGTAIDTARWMAALAGGQVLQPAMLGQMLADEATTTALGSTLAYGLGISTVQLDGHAAIGHSGRYLGVRGVVRYLPDLHLTIAVLTNQGDVDPARIQQALVQVLAPAAPEAWMSSAVRRLWLSAAP